jgi:hypothetical protein
MQTSNAVTHHLAPFTVRLPRELSSHVVTCTLQKNQARWRIAEVLNDLVHAVVNAI